MLVPDVENPTVVPWDRTFGQGRVWGVDPEPRATQNWVNQFSDSKRGRAVNLVERQGLYIPRLGPGPDYSRNHVGGISVDPSEPGSLKCEQGDV